VIAPGPLEEIEAVKLWSCVWAVGGSFRSTATELAPRDTELVALTVAIVELER
jgi:hypothetical protein